MPETYQFSDCGIVGMCEECDHAPIKTHNLNALINIPNEDGMKSQAGQYDFQRQPCDACIALSGHATAGARKPFWRQAVDAVPWTYLTASERDGGAERE